MGTYGGSPTWYELAIKNDDDELESRPDYIEGTIGILKLNGSEVLFAIDGQHRVAGIIEAVDSKTELGDEEVCVIFLKGVTGEHRMDDPEGFERTRRLFTKLNPSECVYACYGIECLGECVGTGMDETNGVAMTIKSMPDDELIHELKRRGYIVYKRKPVDPSRHIWVGKTKPDVKFPSRTLERMEEVRKNSRL